MLGVGVKSAVSAAALAFALLLHAGAGAAQDRDVHANSHRGAKLIARLGCGACHSIPGIENARGLVGPPLDNIGKRTFIAGLLPNTPDNMVRWLETPQIVVPGNAMPNMELSDQDAEDITAYLDTLR